MDYPNVADRSEHQYLMLRELLGSATTPLVTTALLSMTGRGSSIAWYLIGAALLSAVALPFLARHLEPVPRPSCAVTSLTVLSLRPDAGRNHGVVNRPINTDKH
ncbi:hypothetical protein CBM2589_U10208 [Cupriavidus taiwanensis]|uniref:Uncharacterized protein n=1 Tax=Cupriavidus taiwanensis TaxID=164546 RepID=A0A375CQL8_9BURK|nr:hypothetical protein CBM2589_U10208 [Cupriavidus taiwanensis]